MPFKGSNLVYPSLMGRQALRRGKLPATKTCQVGNTNFRGSLIRTKKGSTGLQSADKLAMKPVHPLHHMLLALMSPEALLNTTGPLGRATLPEIKKGREVVNINGGPLILLEIGQPAQVSLESINPRFLTKSLFTVQKVLELSRTKFPESLGIEQPVNCKPDSRV